LSQDLTYEQALEKLDEKLKLLEDGELGLEDALKAVDEARIYLKICTEARGGAKEDRDQGRAGSQSRVRPQTRIGLSNAGLRRREYPHRTVGCGYPALF